MFRKIALLLICPLSAFAQTTIHHVSNQKIGQYNFVEFSRLILESKDTVYSLYFPNSNYKYVSDVSVTTFTKEELIDFFKGVHEFLLDNSKGDIYADFTNGMRLIKSKGLGIVLYDKDRKFSYMSVGKLKKMNAAIHTVIGKVEGIDEN